jgi:kynureninase
MELLSTMPQIDILNTQSKYSGHVAIRVKSATLTTQGIWQQLYDRHIYCDYAPRYDLIRFGMGSLYTSFADVH